jgi:hypothetical protein
MSSGILHHVALQVVTIILEEHVSIFMAEEAENSSKMLVTTCKAT